MREINFDGLVGPSHNYAGLSFGNMASQQNAGLESAPRAAALQGLAKMRRAMSLGLLQGVLLPHERPNAGWLRRLGFSGTDEEVFRSAWAEEPALLANAMSASAMWTANAATVSPAPDTFDERCHLSVANVGSMPHRSIESARTYQQLGLIFANERHFAVHPALPMAFGDEGAANTMRLSPSHNVRGLEIFVYGEQKGGGFPARQHRIASAAIARRHRLAGSHFALFQQSPEAIGAGAFHNDVVAVANEHVLFTHEQAFADKDAVYDRIRACVPEAVIIEAPTASVSLDAAVRTYLFNSQLVSLPEGGMALILPNEAKDDAGVWTWLQEVLAADNPITRLEIVDVRESMRNGGGPACLRLRVPVSDEALASIDRRFMLDARLLDHCDVSLAIGGTRRAMQRGRIGQLMLLGDVPDGTV